MMIAMESALLTNNLLGRDSSDRTPVSFRSWDTLHSRVTQGIVAGAIGDLLILNAISSLKDQQADIFREETKRSERLEYEESRRLLGNSRQLDHERWLAAQKLHNLPPPLERQPGESEAVFELKQLARQEFLSGRFE